MIINYKIYLEKLYILILGVITSFSLPPYNYWFLNFLTFSLLFIFLLKHKYKNIKSFIIFGYLFGFGFFVSNIYWIPFSLTYDENFVFLIPLAIILIPAILSIFYALVFGIFKLFLNSKSIFVSIMSFSLIFGFFEYIRGIFLSGFPWNLFAYSFSENIKFIQITSLIGIYGFNTLIITIFCLPSILYLSKKKIDIVGFTLIIFITICTFFYGSVRVENFRNLQTETLSANIKVLSTNIPIERFYSNVDGEEVLMKLIDLSNPSLNEGTIFIWPEGVIPNINLSSLKNQYDYLLKKSFSEKHTIILGVNNNGATNGTVTFTVPAKDAQNDEINATQAANPDFATDLVYSQIHNQPYQTFIDTHGGIDKQTIIDGKSLVFINTTTEASAWDQGSNFDAYGFDDDDNPFDETTTIDMSVRYDVYNIFVRTIF